MAQVRVLTNAEDLAGDCKLRCTAFIAHTYIHALYELYIPYIRTCTHNCTVQCTYKVRCVVTAKVLQFLLLVHYVVFGRLQAYFVVFCIDVIVLLYCILQLQFCINGAFNLTGTVYIDKLLSFSTDLKLAVEELKDRVMIMQQNQSMTLEHLDQLVSICDRVRGNRAFVGKIEF